MVDAKSFGRSNLLTEFFVRPVHFEKCFHVSLKGILYACTDKTSGFAFVDPFYDRVIAGWFGLAEKA